MDTSIITDSAGAAAHDGLVLTNVTGVVSVTNSAIANIPHNGIKVYNFSYDMTSFTMTGDTVSCASGQPCQPSGSLGNDGLLLVMRGAERTFAAMADLWPNAPIYTLLYDERGTRRTFAEHPVHTSYLQRFGSVTVLNGHIHQVMQKVEGHVAFHTAMSTAYPQPAPGAADSPGPLKVPAGELGKYLGTRELHVVRGKGPLATVDRPIAGAADVAEARP